jgi:N-acetylmuramoyl-L-alanine amidase
MPDRVFARRALLRLLAVAASMPVAHAYAATPRAGEQPARQRALPIVAIDPGHGGADPGAISPSGFYEKDVVLAVAFELVSELARTGRFRPILTRSRDVFVPLRERVARARSQHADLFVSIHADALPDSSLRGLSVYTLSDEASDREAAALAARENRADIVGGLNLSRQPPEIGSILLDLARRQTGNRSLGVARLVVAALGRSVPLLEKPHRSADFAVLTAPDMPSVLVELGCLSNAAEERLLQQRAYRQRLADGLARAISDYFATYGAG